MNGFQNKKQLNLEKPVPGCLGRMVNLFDLSTVAKNKLLTDKPHCEGSPLSRSQSDVARTSPSGYQIEDQVTMSEFKRTYSNKKPNGTPMKMLIDQEMSKEIDTVHNPPSLVAKLMGLDALPQQQPHMAAQRSHSVPHSRSSATPSSYWKENGYLETDLPHEFERYPGQKECADIYEIWQQSRRTNSLRDKSPNKGRYDETGNDKKMDLVRQKFTEAKRLATDEKLRQSKQFQDALEVLSANKDSFLKFLQEPNSLFSQHLYNIQSTPPPPETKRITVLKPSKMMDGSNFPTKNDEAYTKKTARVNGFDKAHLGFSPPDASWKVDEISSQPTRIVVLKPSPARPHDIRATGSPPSASRAISRGEDSFGDSENDVVQESREVAKSITQHMLENLSGHRRDETLISSVFSNGYIGDESSFNKSETEHAMENLSDSEVMSPVSRHSWDYINRVDSPYSCSSFSRASYSPESSVCREAKKRLSERWAMMASNGSYQEPKHVRRGSSTLGEMLALSDVKGSGRFEEKSTNREEHRASSSYLNDNNLTMDEGIDSSPQNLLRSKSVPVSSTVYGARLNVDISDHEGANPEVPQSTTKAKNSKSSFKGKVSSLFFSRTKKAGKEKSNSPQSKGESEVSSNGKINDRSLQHNNLELNSSSPFLRASSSQASSTRLNGKQGIISPEGGLGVKKPLSSGNSVVNQDQPSPISVLERPFEGDEHTASESSFKADRHGLEVRDYAIKSNLIDKSPPIGSISRTLSWDDSCVDTSSSYPLTTSISTRGVAEEEEEWLLFVQTLLSVAGLNSELQLAKWHSPESPLDPSLRDKYIDLHDKEIPQEAKRRQRRSMRKLVFDCVNAAIMDIAGYGSDTCQLTIPYGGTHSMSFKIVDQVWSRMKEWFSGEVRCLSGESGDNNSLVVEMVVRKEVVGNGWGEHLRLEIDILGYEIERKLLEELVEEAVIELTDRR